MIIKTLLQKTNSIDRLDAELLLAHVLKQSREYLFIHEREHVSFIKQYRFKQLINKRKKGIPLAYLTGHKSFFGLDFQVNKHTLIPRPDTEILVEEVINHINQHSSLLLGEGKGARPPEWREVSNTVLLDIGTGSGCIPISIMKTIEQENKKTKKQVTIKTYATDISKPALKVAQKNAAIHNANITFLHGNLLKPFITHFKLENLNFKLFITANLPYLTEAQFSSEPSIQHEPKSALVAKNQGLALYEELLQQLQSWTSAIHVSGSMFHVTCFFEIDPDQAETATSLVSGHFSDTTTELISDLSGQYRIISFEITR